MSLTLFHEVTCNACTCMRNIYVMYFILQWQHLPTNIACPIFFLYWSVINRTYSKLIGAHRGYCFQIHTQNYFKYFYHRPVNVYLTLQDKYNTCALSKHTGRGVVLAKKQFSPTVSFSASAREFSSDFSSIIKGRRSNPSY